MSAIDVSTPRVRPSRWWYLLVPLAFVLGIGGAISAGIDEFGNIDERFTKTGEDGRASIELREDEHASVWVIYENGRSTEAMDKGAVAVAVTGPDGQPVAYEQSTASSTFSFGSTGGIKSGDFVAGEAGTYEIQARTLNPDGHSDVAVGKLDVGNAVWHTLRPALIGFLAGMGLLIALVVLRSRSKRAARQHPQAVGLPTGIDHEPPTPASSQGPISYE